MSKITHFFKLMLSGNPDGEGVSSRGVITFTAFVLCAVAFICNIFFELPLKDYVFNGMLYLVGAGLGFTTIEHFKSK